MNIKPDHLQPEIDQAYKQLLNYREEKMYQILKDLGFRFKTIQEQHFFSRTRLLTVNHEEDLEAVKLYLDYGKPTQKLLAEFNAPEINEAGQLQNKDVYYTNSQPALL